MVGVPPNEELTLSLSVYLCSCSTQALATLSRLTGRQRRRLLYVALFTGSNAAAAAAATHYTTTFYVCGCVHRSGRVLLCSLARCSLLR